MQVKKKHVSELVKLGDLVNPVKGKKPKRISKFRSPEFSLPYINIKAFEKGIIDEYTDGKGCVLCDEEDFLMVWDGSRSGYVGKGMKGALGSTLMKLSFPEIDNDYAYYFLQSKYLDLNTRAKGVGIPHVDPNILLNYELTIPSREIQEKIVFKIEELFSELDKGIENLRLAQQQLKTYRQAVLQSALRGQFTKEWRLCNNTSDIKKFLKSKTTKKELQFNECNSLPINWGAIKLSEISERVSVGHVGPTSEFYCAKDVGIPFLRSQNVRKGKIDFEGVQYITKEFHLKLKKSQLKPGDLLIVRVGANRGDACTLPENMGEINCANIVFARPIKELSKFLHYYFISPLWLNLIAQLTTGSAQGVINTTIVAETVINLPSIEEQNQIIMEIESLLSKADKIEECINKSIHQLEALRQSILKSAFEGCLI